MILEYEPKKRIVLYGPPGCGKTSGLATVPGSLHAVDFDEGMGSLVAEWKRLKRPAKDLSWTTINTAQRPAEVFKEAKNALFHPPPGFDFYALDSYTTFGTIATHHTVGIGDRNYNLSTNTDLAGYVIDYFWEFANTVQKRDAWLIVVMHEKWLEVKDGLSDPKDWRNKKEQLNPDVASGARVTIPARCPFVFHVEKAKAVFGGRAKSVSQYRTRGTPFVMAKAVGFEGVLKEVEEADIGKIVAKLGLKKGPKTKTNKPKPKAERTNKWQK